MSECLYYAYRDHLNDLGLLAGPADWELYQLLKRWSHGPRVQYSDGAATPFIIGELAAFNGLRLKVQTRLLNRKALRMMAWKRHDFRLYRASFLGDFGRHVDKITLAPAIYCAIIPAHAAYYHSPDDYAGACIVMALQLEG